METYKGLRVSDGVLMCECCDINPVAVCAHLGEGVTFYLCVECDRYSRGVELERRCTEFVCPCE